MAQLFDLGRYFHILPGPGESVGLSGIFVPGGGILCAKFPSTTVFISAGGPTRGGGTMGGGEGDETVEEVAADAGETGAVMVSISFFENRGNDW